MLDVLSALLDDFQERPLPPLVARQAVMPRVGGKANVITGMRRAGKTWFCYQTMQELITAGLPKNRLLYLNFEDDRLSPFTAADFQMILDTYFRKFPSHKEERCYFYFDEMQRIPGWDHFVRRLLDTENVSLCVTGSSSKLLSTEIASSIRGRSLATEIFPFNFKEYLRCHRLESPQASLRGSKTKALMEHAFESYLEIGGFPEVQPQEETVRMQILRNYVDVVLLRDVIERYKVRNVAALRALVGQALASPGGRLSISRLYNTFHGQGLACTKNDLYDFLDHLVEAYLLYPAPIYSRSERVRRVNPAKIYAIDTGLLGAVTLRRGDDRGALLENAVYMHLRRQGFSPCYYITRSGREVDFIYGEGSSLRLLQVTWSLNDAAVRQREIQALAEAMQEQKARKASVITFSEAASLPHGIHAIPAWEFLLGH